MDDVEQHPHSAFDIRDVCGMKAPLDLAIARLITQCNRQAPINICFYGLIGLFAWVSGHLGAALSGFTALVVLESIFMWSAKKSLKLVPTDLDHVVTTTMGFLGVRAITTSICLIYLIYSVDPAEIMVPFGIFVAIALLQVAAAALLKRALGVVLVPFAFAMAAFANHVGATSIAATAIGIIAITAIIAKVALFSNRVQQHTLGLYAASRAEQEKLKEVQLELSRSLAIRDQLEHEMGLGFYEIRPDGTAYWSAGMNRAYGRPLDAPPPSEEEVASIIVEEHRERAVGEWAKAMAEGRPFFDSYKVRDKDGALRNLRSISFPDTNAKNPDNRVNPYGHAIIGVVIDETDQLALIERAKMLERRLSTALSVGNACLWEHDFKADKSFAFGATEHFFADVPEASKNIINHVVANSPPEDLPKLRAAMAQSAQSEMPVHVESRIYKADGALVNVMNILDVRFDESGQEYASVVALARDIEYEVEHRQLLADALDAAKEASIAKSSFLANMSHEIRTPLNGVIAVAGTLARSDLTEQQREMVNLIVSSGESLTAVVNDVLDLAKVESGRFDLEERDFSLADLVKGTASLFEVRADDKGLAFEVSMDAPAGLSLHGDPARLRQILSNLVSNAIKFTSTGGVYVDVRAKATGGQFIELAVDVRDTGIGIAEDKIALLFNRFEQLDNSITRQHGGTGLGLAISQALAELMNGYISASSTIGEGTTFSLHLRLPLASKVVEEGPQEMASFETDEDSDDLRILAADDHPTNRQVLKMILEPMGISLTLCENGLEALEAFKIGQYHAVLMDLQMPVMDGLTAIAAMRAHEAEIGLSPTPIAAVSANAMAHHIDEAKAAGANMHVAKPFSPEQLVDRLGQLLCVFDDEVAEEDMAQNG